MLAHVLTAAVWLGAMVYSFFLLHPRARKYFQKPEEFETFIATVSQGARWKVLGALGVIGISGIALIFFRRPEPLTATWLALIGAKVILFLAALGLFVHISWRLWPARIFATTEEIPHHQKVFTRAAACMLLLAGLSTILGILAHTW
jgi:uncharacterized membrane protein